MGDSVGGSQESAQRRWEDETVGKLRREQRERENERVAETEIVLWEIEQERKRQDEKWGIQNHHSLYWSAILGEECGEVCKALLDTPEYGNHRRIREELIQVAAVAVAWIEYIDRVELAESAR